MKKQWISVKCGLSRDPKHRQAMGESIWLFLHILDIASWDDGIAHDWKDEAAAEDMGMPIRTLREHRRKLDELGYISCNQKQYTQDIVIHNWTNPREYNGQVYNEKQGSSETSPQENGQGDTQGYIQGNRKDVTPTLYSKNQTSSDDDNSSPIPKDLVDGILELSQAPGIKREARINDILNYLGVTFRRNTSTKEWLTFAKYIDSEFQSKGWDVKQFVSWLFGQKDYNANYWPVKKMMEFYPSAFVPKSERYNPNEEFGL